MRYDVVHSAGKMLSVERGEVERRQQFNGFRQHWFERRDGVFHGPYTVYWDGGPVICMQGRYADGAQEGVWTYWDRSGKVTRQSTFRGDAEIESRTRPPWYTDVADQALPDLGPT